MWKVNNQQLEELAKCGHASVLHELLQSTFGEADHKLPYALRGHKPFLLARDFGKGRWGHPNDGAREVYRFQLGPRAWSKPIYTYDGHKLSDRLPKYEQEAESLAKTLKLAGWEKIAAQIVSPEIGPNIDKEELSNLQVILCWQEDGRFVTINDREKRLAIAFQWNGDELVLMGEVHPQRLVMLESHNAHDTFELPIVPFEEGMIEHKPAEKAGQIDEFVKAIEWRYATKLDHTLDTLLLEVCDRMDGIEGDIGIAYAGHRFNDGGGTTTGLPFGAEILLGKMDPTFREVPNPSEVPHLKSILFWDCLYISSRADSVRHITLATGIQWKDSMSSVYSDRTVDTISRAAIPKRRVDRSTRSK